MSEPTTVRFAPEPDANLNVDEIKRLFGDVMEREQTLFREVLAPLPPDLLRIIALWCNARAEHYEPAPLAAANGQTYGWHRQVLITRTPDHLAGVTIARALGRRGLSAPQITDELAKAAIPRLDGRVTWESRNVERMLMREAGRRFAWDAPRVSSEP